MSKKGENIYKRKDKRWEARYIKGYTAQGRIRYGYCYGKTYREAKEKVIQAKAANSPGALSCRGDNNSFSYYCDEWLRLNRNRLKQSTYVKYSTMLQKHIRPALGECDIKGLSTKKIGQLTDELLYEKNLSSKSVRDILTVLRSIISYTSRQRPSEMQYIDIIYPKEEKREMRVLSREEQVMFTGYLLDDADECKFGILLALLTGLRIGELCALKWKSISLENKALHVSATMQRLKNFEESEAGKTSVVISSPKSDCASRIIPLTDYAVQLCSRWRSYDPEVYVLTGERGRYMEPRSLQYRLKNYVNECGLEDVHFHVLRHTFATRCVEVGFEIKSLSEILGHANPKFTLERYVHPSFELKRENMDKLSAIGC